MFQKDIYAFWDFKEKICTDLHNIFLKQIAVFL